MQESTRSAIGSTGSLPASRTSRRAGSPSTSSWSTPRSRCSTTPACVGSARRAAVAATEEWRWRAYGNVTHSLRTGQPGFRVAHGCGLWEYLDRHPPAAEWFNDVMSRISAVNAAALVQCYDFAGIGRLVDVGGGYGGLLQAVLQAHPAM